MNNALMFCHYRHKYSGCIPSLLMCTQTGTEVLPKFQMGWGLPRAWRRQCIWTCWHPLSAHLEPHPFNYLSKRSMRVRQWLRKTFGLHHFLTVVTSVTHLTFATNSLQSHAAQRLSSLLLTSIHTVLMTQQAGVFLYSSHHLIKCLTFIAFL